MQMRNAILKRFKITKRGKMLHRPTHQNHFRAKKAGEKKMGKRDFTPIAKSVVKELKRILG